MENDFDGFVNYVYDIKKDWDLSRKTDINDLDLFQWDQQLRLKERERIEILNQALSDIN